MKLLGLTLCLIALALAGARMVREVEFDRGCEGHLENAAHANTIAMAIPEMQLAISYAEAHGLTTGYTSIFYRTPDENVGYWYANLKAATDDLRRIGARSNVSPMEESNVLLKLHETILRSGHKGETTVDVPGGIAAYPRNLAWAVVMVIALMAGVMGAMLLCFGFQE